MEPPNQQDPPINPDLSAPSQPDQPPIVSQNNFGSRVINPLNSAETPSPVPPQPTMASNPMPTNPYQAPQVSTPTSTSPGTVGQVIMGGYTDPNPVNPPSNPASAPYQPTQVNIGGKKWFKKKSVLVTGLVIAFLLGGSAFAYFGYYMNPNFIWSRSLSDMNIGYNRLVSYANTQLKIKYRGVKENGNFNIKSDGSNYSGSLSAQSYGDNTTLSAKVNLGVTNVDLEERSIAVPGSSEPNIYIQINGIKSYLDEFLGTKYDSLNGQWLLIDRSLLKGIIPANSNKASLTWQDVDSFLQSAGKVDQQYVFSSNPKYSVTKVIKKYGFQTINGHKTYHYKVGFVPANVKSYIKAMCSAFGSSSLETYAKQQFGSGFNYQTSCTSLENSTNSITSKDTIDVWADANDRYIYQIRISDPGNPALDYVDLGLNYKPGTSSYPFFISGQDKEDGSNVVYSLVFSLNTSTNSYQITLNAKDGGSSPTTITGNFSIQLNNKPITVTAPANAIPLTTELNNLGLGQYVTELEDLTANSQSVL